MATMHDIETWRGLELHDREGEKVGTIEEIYVDEATGRPEWMAVRTGLFGMKQTFAPVADARVEEDHVVTAYEKDRIKDAPSIDPDGALSPEDERELYEHYGRTFEEEPVAGYERDEARFDRTEAREGDDAMTRSEEELHVGTSRREAGKARLRKYVETENVDTTVPVRREKVRVEREPITEANRDEALSGEPIAEREHEVVLSEEEPVVEKRTVPKERVRLAKESDVENVDVDDEVRKERIEVEGDVETRRTR